MPPDATAAPSNGSSSPTTAAPGVSTSTPSPRSGEGAVAPSAGQGTPQPKGFQPVRLKLPIKDTGETEDVEWASEEDAIRVALRAKAADRFSKKALELERREQQRKEALAKKDYSALKDLGFDADAYFAERLQNELRREQMSAEDRAKEDHDARIKQAEARAQAAERRAQALEQAQAEEREWRTLQPRLGKAMSEAGMLDDTHAWEEVSRVAQEFLAAGIDAPPEVVIKEAAERDRAKFDERLSKFRVDSAPAVWGKFPAEVRKVFGYLAAQEHIKARTNIPAPSEPVPAQVQQEGREEPVGLGERDWLRKLR